MGGPRRRRLLSLSLSERVTLFGLVALGMFIYWGIAGAGPDKVVAGAFLTLLLAAIRATGSTNGKQNGNDSTGTNRGVVPKRGDVAPGTGPRESPPGDPDLPSARRRGARRDRWFAI